jgi:CHAT domain-containing protein
LYRSSLRLSDADDAVVPLYGAAATEEAFCRLAPQYEVLHVSTHGFFLEDRIDVASRVNEDGEIDAGDTARAPTPGLFSGLVLAGANNPPPLPEDPAELGRATYDGYLTADEIAALRLDHTRLVVLPACYSALGQAAGGEGMLGIQRAFQAAGVRATVGALWAVDDAMTQRLMTAFYRNALEGKQSYLEALRAAQLEILNERRGAQLTGADARRGADAPEGGDEPPIGSPYYWAAFTLSGDWR